MYTEEVGHGHVTYAKNAINGTRACTEIVTSFLQHVVVTEV